MKQEQKTHVSADALIQLLKGAKSIRWQLALGVVMSLVLVVCALVIPTQMGTLVQILIDYFDAPETGASVLAQLAPGLLALLGVYDGAADRQAVLQAVDAFYDDWLDRVRKEGRTSEFHQDRAAKKSGLTH